MRALAFLFFSVCPFWLSFAAPVEKPKLQTDEFAIFTKEKYHIFKIRKFEKLKLSANCFNQSDSGAQSQNLKPKCQAFEVAKIKVKNLSSKEGAGTHPASVHCSRMMGENLIAYDYFNNEFDYCRFPDNSLVSSWSLFNTAFQRPRK